jgi:hypothetical protein
VTFPVWIAAQVERHGSLVAFAAVIGVDPTVVGDWRRGHCYPRPDKVEILAGATGTAYAFLTALVDDGRKLQARAIRSAERKPLARVTATTPALISRAS